MARQLAAILGESRRQIEVEWLDADSDVLSGLTLHLARRRQDIPTIVLLDFSSCGEAIWRLVSDCQEELADQSVEWLIVNCEGSVPVFDSLPWGKMTVLANAVIRH